MGEDVAPICDIDNENMRAGAVDIYNKQATAFEDSTNVFAPYYRQTNINALVISDKGEQEIVPGLNDAQIDLERGVVVCTTSDAFVPMPAIFGPASLHGQDYGLYYTNIQENAKTRIDAYLNK